MKNENVNFKDPRARRERLRREEIHLSILRAAEKVILTRGYSATTMDDVAREACLSKATLYKYLPGKGQILFEIVGHCLDEEEEKIRRVVDAEAGAAEKLRTIIKEIVHFRRAKSNIARILMLDKSTSKFLRLIYERDDKAGSEHFYKGLNSLRRKSLAITQLIARVIENGVAAGEFRPVEPAETVLFIDALVAGVTLPGFWRRGMTELPENEQSEKLFVFISSSIGQR